MFLQGSADGVLSVLSVSFAVSADNPPVDGVKMTRLLSEPG